MNIQSTWKCVCFFKPTQTSGPEFVSETKGDDRIPNQLHTFLPFTLQISTTCRWVQLQEKCLGFRSFSWMIQFHMLSVFQVHSPRPHHVAQSLHAIFLAGSSWCWRRHRGMSFFLQNSCRVPDFLEVEMTWLVELQVTLAPSVCAMYLFFESLRLMCLEGIWTLIVWWVEFKGGKNRMTRLDFQSQAMVLKT